MSSGPLVGIVGMARSGRAAAHLALVNGNRVYISDSANTPELQETARELEVQGADVELGGHSVEKLAGCDLVVLSPGIPSSIPPLQDAHVRKVRRVSELEFAFWYINSPILAVTGTNGKSTTTAMAANLLRKSGLDAPAAGNIGVALSEIALRETQPDWVVVEASSFQLADIDEFSPRIGVVTNLAPDHLDRYESVEAYYADKARLFRNSNPYSVWVLNGDDPAVVALPGKAKGRCFYFRVSGELEPGQVGGFIDAKGKLILRLGSVDTTLAHVSEIPLLGGHNHANALAAAIAAAAAEIPLEAIHDGLISFSGLPHRLETVREIDGVCWINDSKATNVSSTKVAIESLNQNAVLLLGGRHKGEPYTRLIDPVRERVRMILAYGEAAPEIVKDLSEATTVEHIQGRFEDVIDRAAAIARPGETVLLSPACASYDMFNSYEERGERFKQLVNELAQVVNG